MATPSPMPDHNRNRLPTLFEVLSRRTLPPVDLFSFYIYMRDQQRSVDYLDFWLDVAQHMSLCRHYVRELRRSVLIGTPDREKGAGSKRSSAGLEILGDVNDPAGPSMNLTYEEKNHDQRLSAFLRNNDPSGQSPHDSPQQYERGSVERAPRASFMSGQDAGTDSASPAHTVARADIRASAEKILYTFLLPGSEREIILPDSITGRITRSIEEEGRDDPEVFDAAKDYVFQAMERDAFPGFLRTKALGNLVPPSMMLRLILGLLSMFGGFWAAFVLIFLDYPRNKRAWITLPFALGVYALASHQYALDPLMALAGFSEYTFMSFSRIREPYVRRLLNKRALTVLAVTVCCVAALVVLFVFVPGKRL
ncbi:MAG: Bud site selection protein, Revert to axial protein 1 [Thelocarpon impressellum]|nr:MAG: Bud site selection protein, Revert to axial protein 1 [Thelocarpon impressellum]